ncbi:hypothetical protein [Paraburkholderia phenoliruptrix]|uniref:hypothetical protein n=1 Tax=Paraburkholderia phenoliruptrix TaxID=252970 RepID=UPI00285FEE40|nr:hypothetical protein [Paraburkholderia phenoliruptrix]MDR6392574.1 hypothetical protein [Paraburkholderia phenoliruptrix]
MAVLFVKRRCVNDGVLLRRSPTAEHVHHLSKSAKVEMNSDNHIDLEIALCKFHELGLEDGDLGYAYWYEVGQLLKRAAGMQAQVDALSEELEQCRARLGKRA